MNLKVQYKHLYCLLQRLFGTGICTRKHLIIMKLTFVITFLFSISAFAEGYGQRINIELKNAAVESVLKEIKKQSGYDMFYNIDLINPLKKTNFRVKNATVDEALKEVTANLGLEYAIEERMIIISKKRESRANQNLIKGVVSGEGDKKTTGCLCSRKRDKQWNDNRRRWKL